MTLEFHHAKYLLQQEKTFFKTIFFFFHAQNTAFITRGEGGSLGPAVAAVWGRAHVVQAHGVLGPGTV